MGVRVCRQIRGNRLIAFPEFESLTPVLSSTPTAAISAGFLALHVYKYQMLSVIAMAMSVTVGAFLAWSLVGGFIHRPLPRFPRVLREGITESEARNMVEKSVPYVNMGLAYVHRILSGKDAFMSVVISCSLFFASRVLATVSLLGLVYAAVVLLFTLPKVYHMYSAEIDGAINMFRQKATFLYDAYLAKALKMIPTAQQATPAESSTTVKKDE